SIFPMNFCKIEFLLFLHVPHTPQKGTKTAKTSAGSVESKRIARWRRDDPRMEVLLLMKHML
ncbi:MAG: hypothetical protein AABY64_08215, partial [Bdellovibrionota bacterium]